MSARATTRLLVDSLGRRVRADGGHLTVLAKGDETAGAMLFILCERGVTTGLAEPARALDGTRVLTSCGPQAVDNKQEVSDYLDRRRRRDPDLWLIELDIAQAERFAAETISVG